MQTIKNNTLTRGQFDENDAENLAKLLASQFSFRNSAKAERIYRPRRIRPQNEFFQMRAIRESGRAPAKQISELALQIFSRMHSRQITRWVIFNNRVNRVCKNGESKYDNLDYRDLMIRCRRVARRVLLRRRFVRVN